MTSGACLGHHLGHVWGIIWGMSGHYLGHAWGIIWVMSRAVCQQWTTIPVKPFFCAICLEGLIAALVLFSVNLTHSGGSLQVLVVLVPVLVLSQRFQLGSD